MLQLTIIILPYTVVSVKKIPVYKRDGVNQIMAYTGRLNSFERGAFSRLLACELKG